MLNRPKSFIMCPNSLFSISLDENTTTQSSDSVLPQVNTTPLHSAIGLMEELRLKLSNF